MAAGAFAYGGYVDVPAPEVQGPESGLLTVADVRTVSDSDPAMRGWRVDSDDADVTVGVIGFSGTINGTSAMTADPAQSTYYTSDDPFTVYGSYAGVMPIRSPEEANARAAARLTGVEGLGVEQGFWSYSLAKRAAGNVLNGGTAVSSKLGLGLLADWMGSHYIGVPYIHSGLRASNDLAGAQLISLPSEGPPATRGGAILVPGMGYGATPTINTKADGSGTAVTPGANQVWLFGSGAPVLYRGGINHYEAPAWLINQVQAFAERTYVPGIVGPVAAVLITLT